MCNFMVLKLHARALVPKHDGFGDGFGWIPWVSWVPWVPWVPLRQFLVPWVFQDSCVSEKLGHAKPHVWLSKSTDSGWLQRAARVPVFNSCRSVPDP